MTIQKLIIALGIAFIIIGILFPYISKIGLFKLPGDIYFGVSAKIRASRQE